ncbi:hypothetical protein EVAR_17898_1 [Eumeta japonica]|uniref:FLYWCH-type domain-containing protein n=1 Tax=Eumeta variegata TaxID=151549 RepID=A0A4C1UYV3_EUMVA|nr:hypothetical protein EVAR_17898_1 [Eumeta japonica]
MNNHICANKLLLEQYACGMYRFEKSAKGKRILVLGAYRYCVVGVFGPKTHWICSTHKGQGCRAIVHTIKDQSLHKKGRVTTIKTLNTSMHLAIYMT